jgi:prepilin-type N-terminal cleavage/methylation domain-containing protein
MKRKNDQRGFTLVELMTSLSIFALVVTVSLGAILGVFAANRKSRALKTVVSNLNLAVEDMSKEMRYGRNYHCGSGTVTLPQDCPGGDTSVSFLSSDNLQVSYRLNGTTFEKQLGISGEWLPVVSADVVIDSLNFYVTGSTDADSSQPKTLVNFKGHVGSGQGRSDFALETVISQRALDVAGASAYTYPTPATLYTLTVTKAGAGSGTVSGSGISCGSTCNSTYVDGSGVSLTAAASGGSTFAGWSGACSGTGTCNLTMNGNKAVTATFANAGYTIEYLVVAGGGGGGALGGPQGGDSGGGGGGGGVIVGSSSVQPGGTALAVTVGAGGGIAGNGGNSSLGSLATAIGGGRGASWGAPGVAGGAGGGGGGGPGPLSGGSGTAGQGYAGGAGSAASYRGGGGGGAGGSGSAGASDGGVGGPGVTNAYSGASVVYGGGGGGGGGINGGAGGIGGGGRGSNSADGSPVNPTAGTANRGGGGGGPANRNGVQIGGMPGGSGIVIIRYAGAQRGTGGTVSSSGGYTIHTFTSSGTYNP